MNSKKLVATLIFVLYALVCETNGHRTAEDYLDPLFEALDMKLDDVRYEAEWFANKIEMYVEWPDNAKEFIDFIREAVWEPYSPLLIGKNKSSIINPMVMYYIQDGSPKEIAVVDGLKNLNINPKGGNEFAGSSRILSNILDSFRAILEDEDRARDLCSFKDLLMMVAVSRVLYGRNGCRLTVNENGFKVERSPETSTRYPKLKKLILDRGLKHVKNCMDNNRHKFKEYVYDSNNEGWLELDEMLTYRTKRTLQSDYDLFNAARELSFRDFNHLKTLGSAIRFSRRFLNLPQNLDTVYKMVQNACINIRSGLEKSVGIFVMLIGIDSCSVDPLNNINLVFARMNEYLRLCNEYVTLRTRETNEPLLIKREV